MRIVSMLQGMAIAGLLMQWACGGGGSTGSAGNTGAATTPANPVSVTLVGIPSAVVSGASLTVSAQVQGSTNTAVTWTVDSITNGNANVGIISSTGNKTTYVAPANAGNHVLAAVSVADPSVSGSAQVAVVPASATPTSPSAGPVISAVTASSVTQTGATISWTLNEVGTGQVFYGLTTAYGSTTTPELSFNYSTHAQGITGLTAGTLYHFCVKSADQAGNLATSGGYTFTTASATSSNPPTSSITTVSVSPASLTLSPGAQSSLTATVAGTGTFSYGVAWSCLHGTITSGGLYTAPATAGNDTVTATSVQDGTKTATSSITVLAAGSIPSGTSVRSAPYNAKGDGVTDDTAAIQACINVAAGTGGTVVVPDGTYMINPVVGSGIWGLMLGSNMTFAMTSGATLKAIGVSSSTYGILCSNGGSNITISGGNIVGERATHTGSGGESGMGIYLNASNVTVTGVTVSECWGDGFYVCDNSSNITFTNCVGNHNRRQGLSITAGNTFLVTGCTFSNTTGTDPQCGIDIEPNGSVPVTGVHITNCQIFNNVGGGVQQGNVGNVASGTLLENCNIYGNGGGGYNDGGIRFVETHDNTIRNNQVHNNLNGGIRLESNAGIGCPNTNVTGNTVTNNTGYGITAELCNGSVITGNTISGNSGTAFYVDGSSGTYSPNTIP